MDVDETRTAVEHALTDAFHGTGEMVTRWALVAESIDDTGERGLWTMAAEDMHAWETLGMMTFALQREQAKAVAQETDD